jgi:hypothetical protein
MRTYTLPLAATSVSAAVDLAEIVVPAGAMIVVRSAFFGQISDTGDAQAELLSITMKRGVGSTSGSGGSTQAASKHETGDAAFSTTPEIFNTTQAVAGGGSLTTLPIEAENVQAGWYYTPTPEELIYFGPGESIIFSQSAPADAITVVGRITFTVFGAA